MRLRARAVIGGLLAVCALLGLAAAFAVAAPAGLSDTGTSTSSTSSTESTTTGSTTTTTEPTTTTPVPPRQARIADGVSIGHVDVGGMTPERAEATVRRAFARPLVLVIGTTAEATVGPGWLDTEADFTKAVSRARVARPGASVPLDVTVSRARIRSYLDRLGQRVDRAPVDAKLVLRGIVPVATPSRPGRRLNRVVSASTVRVALKTNERGRVALTVTPLPPEVTDGKLGPAIVILRSSNRLRFYVNAKLVRTFGVATGQSAYPTPLGSFTIVVKEKDPWWYPPPSPWAANEQPVPPGPGNPLGTRWMGLSAPYVGIHGTPDAASIGYSASHGCIRMRIPDAEWLFQQVKIGTPVFIVAH